MCKGAASTRGGEGRRRRRTKARMKNELIASDWARRARKVYASECCECETKK